MMDYLSLNVELRRLHEALVPSTLRISICSIDTGGTTALPASSFPNRNRILFLWAGTTAQSVYIDINSQPMGFGSNMPTNAARTGLEFPCAPNVRWYGMSAAQVNLVVVEFASQMPSTVNTI